RARPFGEMGDTRCGDPAPAAQKPHCARDDGLHVQAMGERMRGLRAVVAIAAIVALTASAEAQMGQGMLQGANANRQNDRPGGAPPPQEKSSKRANDKDYKSSLERLPDQKYDPWAKTR